MKKLNRKGFTLVELLATVVILSLVTGVAVPVTTNVVSTSKHKALGTFVDEAENYIADQWKIKKVSPDTMSLSFKSVIENYNGGTGYKAGDGFIMLSVTNDTEKKLIDEMGIPSKDVSTVHFLIASDNIPCVVISKIPNNSGIYNSLYWDKADGAGNATEVIPTADNNRYYSKCCIKETVDNLFTGE